MRHSTRWQLTNDMCLCCTWAHSFKCHRVCMQSIGVWVCSVSNVMTSGCRKIDDVIETSRLFFAPSGRGPQVSNSAPLPPPPLISRICLPPFFYPSLLFLPSNHQTPCPLLFSQALRWITGFRNMASVHCSFCLHSGRLWTWQWWRGWCEG